MNTILRNACPPQGLYTLSILVISVQNYCFKIKEALRKIHKNKGYYYNISVTTTEKVSDILEFTNRIHVDFVIFILDTSNRLCVNEVELNFQLMDSSFLRGRTCIVNGTPYQPDVSERLDKIIELADKYNVPFINGDVMDSQKCLLLAERILILVNSTYNHKTPLLPWIFS